MFRSDRDALARKVDDLRAENERLRSQNEAMRHDLLDRRAQNLSPQASVYAGGEAGLGAGEQAALATHQLRAFPVWATVVLHLLTFGASSFFRFNLMHDRLPKAQHDDPSAVKSIGFHLIPYFNFYWMFWNGLRLADRLNLQLRLRGMNPTIARNAVITAGVLTLVPYVSVIASPIAWLAVAISMQRAVNALAARADQERMDREASEEASTRLRVPEVRDLPLPEDVAAEAEAEADAAQNDPRRWSR